MFFWAAPLAEPHTCPTPVFVDEFDAGALQRTPNHLKSGVTRLTNSGLKLVHGYYAHTSLLSQLLLAPGEKAARGSALLRGDHE